MILKPRDFLTFEVLQRHGPLPSLYLHEFTKHLARDAFVHRKRLYQLTKAGYLARPIELNHPAVQNDFIIYVLTDKSKEVLRDIGKAHKYAEPVGGGYYHMLMASYCTASIELECAKAGYRYISQEEILEGAPKETQSAKHPLSLPCEISYAFKGGTQSSSRPTIPDQLFGIDYNGAKNYFAVEIDRATEPVERTNLTQNSYLRKILCYRAINRSHVYKTRWGIPSLIVLNITVNETHRDSIIEKVKEVAPGGISNFVFQVIPPVAHFTRVPGILSHLWRDGWKRHNKEPFLINHP